MGCQECGGDIEEGEELASCCGNDYHGTCYDEHRAKHHEDPDEDDIK